jgi:hypothetical protein
LSTLLSLRIQKRSSPCGKGPGKGQPHSVALPPILREVSPLWNWQSPLPFPLTSKPVDPAEVELEEVPQILFLLLPQEKPRPTSEGNNELYQYLPVCQCPWVLILRNDWIQLFIRDQASLYIWNMKDI